MNTQVPISPEESIIASGVTIAPIEYDHKNHVLEAPGFKMDLQAIAEGLIQIFHEEGHTGCFGFGMLPAEIIQSFEADLKRRIPDQYAYVGDNSKWKHDMYDGTKLRGEVQSRVYKLIYQIGTEKGQIVV